MSKKKEPSVRLSKKHGLQPTMPLCYYCGEPKGTIALLGEQGDRLAKDLGRSDGEMPMSAWIPGDIEPCDKCREKGIAVCEVQEDGRHLTGRRWVVRREAFNRQDGDENVSRILDRGVALVTPDVAERLGLHDMEEKRPNETGDN